ncbi:GNAT family N-acetyltransferase [Motilimonas cestriensis]|uniref:GNAT family N-acetyltransferase n=1 Tax=Motilimonas cestriensis TaxID=2742685 RepID=A0ABS8WDU6_9GAMM|nr:GNAT family N-acetyltransferase [Motilimonas cestriensis]MCE2596430.1 GNAT family N-acetyltransferase [Motilimonas cestriensis]
MTISFVTPRLTVVEVEADISLSERSQLLACVPTILTPAVVAALPADFHDVNTPAAAEVWLDSMLSQSRLLLVKSASNDVIGFLFVYVTQGNFAHIGYLLAQAYWGKGLATELLYGFMADVGNTQPWQKLVAGVDQTNIASAKLLKKLGFVEQMPDESSVAMFEYILPQTQV